MIETISWIASFTAIVIAMLILALERRKPSATLAWVLTLVFLPWVGVILYFVLGRQRANKAAARYAKVVETVDSVLDKLKVRQEMENQPQQLIDERSSYLFRLGRRLASTPPIQGNYVTMLVDAATAYQSMSDAIDKAQEFIHVDFYIIQPDETGCRLRDKLTERAREGVEVRVTADGVGSGKLPDDFWDPLIEVGGKFAMFSPVSKVVARLPFRDRIDFRNHRKIVIVDGKVGFTGGINVGREYLGLDPVMGHWRDTHIRIEGPAVLSLQKVFAEDWLHASDELLYDPKYFPPAPSEKEHAPLAVQVIDSGPDRTFSPISYIFSQAFALSRERLWVTNPYFVPNTSIYEGLISAALRGVDVRLLLPMKPDHRLVAWAASSYFPELLEAGVRIFRYARGFVHAKTMVVDDWVGTIGSANMDMRSFHLNYEINAFVYGKEFCDQLAAQFVKDLDAAEEASLAEERSRPFLSRALSGAAQILSPIL